MKRILLATVFIPFCLIQVSQNNLLNAQVADASEITDTAGIIEFTLFPDGDPFLSTEPIRIVLEFDMKKLIRDKHKDQYQEAILRWVEADGDTMVQNLKIKARGVFRKRHCLFPPITLNFKKSEQGTNFLNDVNKLKLVTHCRKSKDYQQYLFKEFLMYQMFNLLTDNSFRVRLFIIEYRDSQNKRKSMENYGFVIESNSLLSNRLNALIIEKENIRTWDTDPYQANLMALFQYMTGNHDWEIAKLHNIRLVKSLTNPLEKIIPIPYDFDYSGMVNTHYALPPEALGIESVRTRFYRGYCLSTTEEYQEYFQKFLDVKEEMYALVQNFELLDSRHSDEMIDYLDSYYTIIENPRLAKMNIIDFCKQIPSR